ncbi:MAG: hypothetical protein ACKPKO_37185, partial [Candidatus Fonsibacter sp.]
MMVATRPVVQGRPIPKELSHYFQRQGTQLRSVKAAVADPVKDTEAGSSAPQLSKLEDMNVEQ